MSDSYLSPATAVSVSVEVKRSVFRCDLSPVHSEAEARAAVEEARRAFWEARHHCSAFVLGPASQVRRSNDDGEPSGTAGMPMLDVLVGAGVSDAVAVVSRWFGGTLLGTGGLVKAYGDAVREALQSATLERYAKREVLRAQVDVANIGRVEHGLRSADFAVLDVTYPTGAVAEAVIEVGVAPAEQARVGSLIAELTSGRSVFTPTGHIWTKV